MTTNPPRHPDLFAPILCEYCPTPARTDRGTIALIHKAGDA